MGTKKGSTKRKSVFDNAVHIYALIRGILGLEHLNGFFFSFNFIMYAM